MRITKEYNQYRECVRNLHRSGKTNELSRKIENFFYKRIGFIVRIRKVDYDTVINRDRRFWQELGFKEINIQSTKNKRANKLIKKSRKRKGKIYYSCMTKNKLLLLLCNIDISFLYLACPSKIKRTTNFLY